MNLEEAIKLLKQYQGYEAMFPDGEKLKHAFDLTDETVDTLLSALRPVSREQLSEFKTCDLVDELRKREGVETHIAEPYQDVTVSVNGPAVVLVVID
jgi:hypothetical protein